MYYTWSGWWWLFWVVPMGLLLWAVLAGSGRGYSRLGARERYFYDALDDRWFPRYRSSSGRKYRNRAPLDYQRSDARIREDVCDRLMIDDELDPSAIDVRVANGEVVLTGTVSSRSEKRLAEQIADLVPGVNDVDNRLKIGKVEATSPTPPGHAIPGAQA